MADPRHGSDCDAVQEQLPAYALGALERADAAAVARHLPGCAACSEQLRQLQSTAAQLATTAAQAIVAASPPRAGGAATPSPALRDRLLLRVAGAAEPTSEPAREPTAAAVADAGHTADAAAGTVATLANGSALTTPKASDQRPPGAAGWRQWLLPAVLAAALLVSVGLNLLLGLRVRSERRQIAALAAVLAQQEVVLEVVDSDATVRRFLRPAADQAREARAYGKLFTRPQLPYVVVMAARLPRAPADFAYHVRLTRADGMSISEPLAVNDEGFGLLVRQVADDEPLYVSAEVLLTGGASQPRPGSTTSPDTILAWSAGE